MYTVKLNDLKYYAYHGLFPQERKTGNQFLVSVSVSMPLNIAKENDLGTMINYVALKDVVDKYMSLKFDLLEDILGSIKEEFLILYPEASGEISIKKIQPPFGGSCASSEVIITF